MVRKGAPPIKKRDTSEPPPRRRRLVVESDEEEEQCDIVERGRTESGSSAASTQSQATIRQPSGAPIVLHPRSASVAPDSRRHLEAPPTPQPQPNPVGAPAFRATFAAPLPRPRAIPQSAFRLTAGSSRMVLPTIPVRPRATYVRTPWIPAPIVFPLRPVTNDPDVQMVGGLLAASGSVRSGDGSARFRDELHERGPTPPRPTGVAGVFSPLAPVTTAVSTVAVTTVAASTPTTTNVIASVMPTMINTQATNVSTTVEPTSVIQQSPGPYDPEKEEMSAEIRRLRCQLAAEKRRQSSASLPLDEPTDESRPQSLPPFATAFESLGRTEAVSESSGAVADEDPRAFSGPPTPLLDEPTSVDLSTREIVASQVDTTVGQVEFTTPTTDGTIITTDYGSLAALDKRSQSALVPHTEATDTVCDPLWLEPCRAFYHLLTQPCSEEAREIFKAMYHAFSVAWGLFNSVVFQRGGSDVASQSSEVNQLFDTLANTEVDEQTGDDVIVSPRELDDMLRMVASNDMPEVFPPVEVPMPTSVPTAVTTSAPTDAISVSVPDPPVTVAPTTVAPVTSASDVPPRRRHSRFSLLQQPSWPDVSDRVTAPPVSVAATSASKTPPQAHPVFRSRFRRQQQTPPSTRPSASLFSGEEIEDYRRRGHETRAHVESMLETWSADDYDHEAAIRECRELESASRVTSKKPVSPKPKPAPKPKPVPLPETAITVEGTGEAVDRMAYEQLRQEEQRIEGNLNGVLTSMLEPSFKATLVNQLQFQLAQVRSQMDLLDLPRPSGVHFRPIAPPSSSGSSRPSAKKTSKTPSKTSSSSVSRHAAAIPATASSRPAATTAAALSRPAATSAAAQSRPPATTAATARSRPTATTAAAPYPQSLLAPMPTVSSTLYELITAAEHQHPRSSVSASQSTTLTASTSTTATTRVVPPLKVRIPKTTATTAPGSSTLLTSPASSAVRFAPKKPMPNTTTTGAPTSSATPANAPAKRKRTGGSTTDSSKRPRAEHEEGGLAELIAQVAATGPTLAVLSLIEEGGMGGGGIVDPDEVFEEDEGTHSRAPGRPRQPSGSYKLLSELRHRASNLNSRWIHDRLCQHTASELDNIRAYLTEFMRGHLLLLRVVRS